MRSRPRALWRPPFIACLVVLALALSGLGIVLTAGTGPNPVSGPTYGEIIQESYTHWSPTFTQGDALLTNHSKRPAMVSFVSAKTKDVQVVSVYLTAHVTKPAHPGGNLEAVGSGYGLPTSGTYAVRGVLSWPHRLKLPATIPPGKTQWQIVWGIRTGGAGGYIHGATLRISQGGHSWLTHSQVWVLTPKKH